MYMLDSDQEPSYNLSKNLLLLPRILKLIKDMVDDSTPLLMYIKDGPEFQLVPSQEKKFKNLERIFTIYLMLHI